jgi:RNase P subunit RPR2
MKDSDLICSKCNIPLVMQKAVFSYLKHEMYVDLPRCPKCGLTFIPEELVNGKMAQVEKSLEDK